MITTGRDTFAHELCGWNSRLPAFQSESPKIIRVALNTFIEDASKEQVRAWDQSIPVLQHEARELIRQESRAADCYAILEYKLPLESRRPDVIVLLAGPIVVLELKSTSEPSQASLDQVSAYARDLRSYHRSCADRPVHSVVVPMHAQPDIAIRPDGTYVVGPAGLDKLLVQLMETVPSGAPSPEEFLSETAYCPLPTLVQAARELLESRSVRNIWRAKASREPAVDAMTAVAHQAAAAGQRHLTFVAGVPGSGKTLVGLRAVHAKYLDDLAVARPDGKPTAPGLFLSGNDPLVQVLQYALKGAGGDGKTFVRGLKDYLNAHVRRPSRIPDQHVICFDEAQRAFNREKVADSHPEWEEEFQKSEPELILEIAERIPGWASVIGLIGTGQEIHKGEEGGLEQWRDAINKSGAPASWTVHIPPSLASAFTECKCDVVINPALSLDAEIRYHLTAAYSVFVEAVLDTCDTIHARALAKKLQTDPKEGGMRLYITRSIDDARNYLFERYAENVDARYGIVASSKDKTLESGFQIPNSYQSTKRVKLGRWYCDEKQSPHSCCQLRDVVTEFGAQGLELDMALLAWGTDFLRMNDRWSNQYASGYRQTDVKVKDPHRLRLNSYRVLMTRGRDGTIVFVPPMPTLDETYRYLMECGFTPLK